jgi:hypothetical protein
MSFAFYESTFYTILIQLSIIKDNCIESINDHQLK